MITVPCDKYAIPEVKAVLEYLNSIEGKAIITGQHTQTNPMEEITYIEELTGKSPKLRGFEMLAYSPNINYGDASKPCLDEIYDNRGTMDTAIQ